MLLDEQRVDFERCMKQIDRVLAAHLWASLVADDRIDGSVVLTTTSGSQRSNWEALFEKTAGHRAARGVVVAANRYNPGLSPPWVKKERSGGSETRVSDWKRNLERFLREEGRNRSPDDGFAISIVDEAHALIDPTVPGKEGVSPSGWAMHAGPQAWHVIRSSRVSVFLMDGEQRYRDNETTTRARIEAFAADHGVDRVEVVDLAGAQFRCGGSPEYMRWLGATLGLGGVAEPVRRWRRGSGGPFGFDLVDDPQALDDALRARLAEGRSARLLASYARKWITKGASRPHALPPEKKDFQIAFSREGAPRVWSTIWNFAPEGDYTPFVQAPGGSRMAADPLSEVGCPYVVRGFDDDHVGGEEDALPGAQGEGPGPPPRRDRAPPAAGLPNPALPCDPRRLRMVRGRGDARPRGAAARALSLVSEPTRRRRRCPEQRRRGHPVASGGVASWRVPAELERIERQYACIDNTPGLG